VHKYQLLRNKIKDLKKVTIAFSGGVDSSLLLMVALKELGKENVFAVLADSPVRLRKNYQRAKQMLKDLELNYKIIKTDELANQSFRKNDKLRCYYCKYEMFKNIRRIAENEGMSNIIDGTNFDDVVVDYRPGLKALKEFEIISPLKEAGLSKEEIRKLSRDLDLPTWDQPSDTCLATRIAYGMEINSERLRKVREIEDFLAKYKLKEFRARMHDENSIRLEVQAEDVPIIINNRSDIYRKISEYGFNYVSLDLKGYRSGSMNELINKENK